MSKKEFLNLLEKKLNILDENERKDIINEYKDTIEEKVKNGQNEKEAVADFGDIDLLCKEILSAYKINPDYGKEEEIKIKPKEILKSSESLIKKWAKKLADATEDIINNIKNSNNEITIELIFEIVLKSLLFLIIIAVIRIPFWIISKLGLEILSIFFFPVDVILGVVWNILIGVIYFIVCVLIGIAMFKMYFKNNSKKKDKKVKNEKITEAKEEINEIKEEKNETKTNNILINIITTIIKIFVVIVFLIPLWFIILGFYLILAFLIFLLFKEVTTVFGLIIIIIGLIILFTTINSIIHKLTFTHKKIRFYPFIISAIFIFSGSLLFSDKLINFKYYNKEPITTFEITEKVYEFDLNNIVKINVDGNKEIIIDNTIKDNEIIIKAEFYSDLVTCNYYKGTNISNERIETINFYATTNEIINNKQMYDLVLNNLKNEEIYNYNKLYDLDIKIYVNENTADKIN